MAIRSGTGYLPKLRLIWARLWEQGEWRVLLLCGVNLQTTVLLALPGVLAVWWLTNYSFVNIHPAPGRG